MTAPRTSASDVMRRALLKISPSTVLEAVDSLDLRAANRISAVVGVPLRTLQQRRDVADFAAKAPIAAVRALTEILAAGPLDDVVRELAEHADNPTFDQLSDAIDRLSAQGVGVDSIVAVLSFAVGEEFAAAPHCRRLLEERPPLELPTLPASAPAGTLASPKEVDPQIRAQRQARREAQRQQRQRKSPPTRPSRPGKSAPSAVVRAKPVATGESPAPLPAPSPLGRRPLMLTPSESARFSTENPLVAAVVLIEVPFDSLDPDYAELRSKERPALVVAASESGVLVRPIYSNTFTNRTLFSPWRRLLLDHVCYISDDRVALDLPTPRPEELGRLSDEEWNALS